MSEIDVRDCPKCENGTKGNYDGRVLIGGRGIFTCPVCGDRWQDANEKPSSKGIPIRLRRDEERTS
jgi:hypothetical protein